MYELTRFKTLFGPALNQAEWFNLSCNFAPILSINMQWALLLQKLSKNVEIFLYNFFKLLRFYCWHESFETKQQRMSMDSGDILPSGDPFARLPSTP